MTDKTLPERMREAAGTLMEARDRQAGDDPHRLFAEFCADDLRRYADEWEREDAEKAAAEAAHEAGVEELAEALHRAWWGDVEGITDEQANVYRRRARDLIAAGWRKQATL